MRSENVVSRRDALSSLVGAAATSCVLGGTNVGALLGASQAISEPDAGGQLFGKAEHVISIWLGGGMGQIDTFDPKRKGDPKAKKAGSYYDSIDTVVPGVQVCEHLAQMAHWMDRTTAVRSVHHEVIDEHAAATNRMHTGRAITNTIVYPSLGSLIVHERGAAQEGAPPYVLIGYPNVTRGPGFLGASSGYMYLTDTSKGPAGLSRPADFPEKRQRRREGMLKRLAEGKDSAANSAADSSGKNATESRLESSKLADYRSAAQQSYELSSPSFQRSFDLSLEPDDLRNRYGGEFGQRCLLSRRLIERGVRFIEVSHNLNFLNGAGWDVHNEGILEQHSLIRELDQAMSALMFDLDQKKMLDKTLIVITSEFGRPPEFDSGGGRGHQGKAFTCVLAGGGLNHQGAYGETDELSKNIVSSPVSVPDFFATICQAVQVDSSKELFDGDRPVPITDGGTAIRKLLI